MKNVQEFLIFAESFCAQDGDQYSSLPDVVQLFRNSSNHSMSSVEALGALLSHILKKAILTRRVQVFPGKEPKVEFDEELMRFHEESLKVLRDIVRTNREECLQVASVKVLFSLLPIQCKLSEKSKFPIKEFSMDLECVISAENNFNSLLGVLEPYLIYQDVSASLWQSLTTVIHSLRPLSSNHVKNIISVVEMNKTNSQEPNTKTLCGNLCKSDKKKVGVVVRRVWEGLTSVQLPDEIQQKLSLTLIEHMMPVIDKPVTLTDYFMTCFNRGGPNALIALQGIFNLIQKYNINYPNVYCKLYTMIEPAIFDTPYKARFYYLADIFLSSLCLPVGMVAGFIKRFSRISLVAPPEDIIILMAFITNLLIRHPSLKYLINCTDYQSVESDPYNYDEKDPAKSGACDSSLWEVRLLQEHVLPSVSAAATFINTPLPSVQKDLSTLLDNTSSLIFGRECKKRMREIPVNFERHNSISFQNTPSAFHYWSLV